MNTSLKVLPRDESTRAAIDAPMPPRTFPKNAEQALSTGSRNRLFDAGLIEWTSER